jgi:hypothetical protein
LLLGLLGVIFAIIIIDLHNIKKQNNIGSVLIDDAIGKSEF